MSEKRADILYPCEWKYRIIGSDEGEIRSVASTVIGHDNYSLIPSNQSSSGTYCSFLLTITVDSEEHRVSLFNTLKESEHIKMVL